MIVAPLIVSIVYEVSRLSPDLTQASLAVGATQWQTIRNEYFPGTAPGIIATVRARRPPAALGETIAVYSS